MGRRRFVIMDMSKGHNRQFIEDISAYLATKKNPYRYLERLLLHEMKREGFDFDPLPERERGILDFLKADHVIHTYQARAAGLIDQPVQLQRAVENLKREGHPVGVCRTHRPYLYYLGISEAEAIAKAGKAPKLSRRQLREVEVFEKGFGVRIVVGKVEQEGGRWLIFDEDDKKSWLADALDTLRKKVPKLDKFTDRQIVEAVREGVGILALMGAEIPGGND